MDMLLQTPTMPAGWTPKQHEKLCRGENGHENPNTERGNLIVRGFYSTCNCVWTFIKKGIGSHEKCGRTNCVYYTGRSDHKQAGDTGATLL